MKILIVVEKSMTELQRVILLVILWVAMFIGLIIVATLLPSKAHAHSEGDMHYDNECCHNEDCAPVLQQTPAHGGLIMETKHGKVYVPNDLPKFKIKKSTDGRFHVCQRRFTIYDKNDPYSASILCVYYPELY